MSRKIIESNLIADVFNIGANIGVVQGIGGENQFNLNVGTATTLTGGSGNDTFNLNGGAVTNPIDGGDGTNTINGQNIVNAWTISSANAGSVGAISFTKIQNLNGGNTTDVFSFNAGSSISGNIDG